MDRFDLINMLIERFGYKNYLEIGVYNPVNCFDKVKAESKIGVEPFPHEARETVLEMTSDTFFAQNKIKFDIVFVDGLHHDDQVERDITNSLNALNSSGMIIVHDCNPLQEDHQKVPAVVPFWCGTVWKGWVRLRHKLSGVDMFVLDMDTGIGVIKRNDEAIPFKRIPEDELTFANLDLNRKEWLNIISFDEFMDSLPIPEKDLIVAEKKNSLTKIDKLDV